MNTCIYRPWIGFLVFMLAIGFVAPAAAQKAALVRDVDRPSVAPVAATCNAAGGVFCRLLTVPPTMVFVLESVSYRASLASPSTARLEPTLSTSVSTQVIYLSDPIATGGTTIQHASAIRAYYLAGDEVVFLIDPAGAGLVSFVTASIFGHLVAAGSP